MKTAQEYREEAARHLDVAKEFASAASAEGVGGVNVPDYAILARIGTDLSQAASALAVAISVSAYA